MTALLALLIASLALATSAQAARPEAAAIETENNLFFVDCKVDGVAERCQLDSGDNGMATLRRSDALAKLPVVRAGKTMGVSGVMAATSVIHVDRLSIGDMAVEDLDEVHLLTRPHPFSSLGLRFFERLETVTFDFRGAELRRQGPVQGRQCPGAFEVDELIKIPATIAGKKLTAAWDTGSSVTVADAAYVSAHPELFEYVRDLPNGSDVTSTDVLARLFKARRVSICGQEFRNISVVAIDMSAPKAMIPNFPDITLGANLMVGRVWAFDFKDRTWSLD